MLRIVVALSALGILSLPFGRVDAQCPLTCLSQVSLSLAPDGTGLFTPANGLASLPPACAPDYAVSLFDENQMPIGNPVDCSRTGQNLFFHVTYLPTGNYCWGRVLVEDKIAPSIACMGDTVLCNEPSDPAHAGSVTAGDNCDPDPAIQLVNEVIRDLACDRPDRHIREIERQWVAIDSSGNVSFPCTQIIRIQRALLSDITFPANRTGALAIPCDTPDIDPAITGYPSVFGGQNDVLCKVVFTHSDDTLATCAGAFTVQRTWTAVDCCTNTMINHVQTIAVVDRTAPAVICPPHIFVSTKTESCNADITLLPAIATDNCSADPIISVITSWGGSGLGPFLNVPEGGYKAHYIAEDECGNRDTCSIDVTIKDLVPPTALCRFPITAYLDANGKDTITVEDVSAGSFDNCSMSMGQIKFMGEPDSLFRDSLIVGCQDMDGDRTIILRVTDCFNNSGSCMTPLLVKDTLAPVLLCAMTTELECTAFDSYPDIGEPPFVADNCSGTELVFTDSIQLDDCNVGHILRTWTAKDNFNNSVSCTQYIGLTDTTLPSIIWPLDTVLPCSKTIDPLDAGAPIVTDNCALLAVGYTDSVIVVDNACDTIFRTWRVKDWCSDFDSSYTQRIDLFDDSPPTFTDCPDDEEFILDGSCLYFVDLDSVQIMEECGHFLLVTNDSPHAFENGGNASGLYPPGEYFIHFRAADACNEDTCTTRIVVRDATPPFLVCKPLTDTIGADSMYILDPWLMVTTATDLCSPVILTASDTLFDCNDILKKIAITITATDTFGNTATCVDTLFLLNNGACGPLVPGDWTPISGKVTDPLGNPLAQIPISFDFGPHLEWRKTDQEGQFSSQPYPQWVELEVRAHPKLADLEGITTADVLAIQAHLSGISPLGHPLAQLAADVNRSGSVTIADVIALRKSIIRQEQTHGAGYWRLAPASSLDSLAGATSDDGFWQGALLIHGALQTTEGQDFIGIKTGDVNFSWLEKKDHGTGHYRTGDVRMPATVRAGEPIPVQLSLTEGGNMTGLQFGIGFDPEKVRFVGLDPIGTEGWGKDDLFTVRDGLLRIRWDNLENRYTFPGAPLMTFRFEALQDIGSQDWLWLDRQDLPAEVYAEEGMHADLQLRWPEQSGPTEGTLVLHSPQPNPFVRETRISFDLTEESLTRIAVFDLKGSILYEVRGTLPAGRHTIPLNEVIFPTTGIYQFQVRTEKSLANCAISCIKD